MKHLAMHFLTRQYIKPSLFMGVKFLKNPVNGKLAMCEVKIFWEKLE
jgi:hypothetical protein